MSSQYLSNLSVEHSAGRTPGITAICSAHPLVIEATFLQAKSEREPVLIEATCNQVNQEGGYTGMTPQDFRNFVENIATETGFDTSRLILGGDHLGPNPWRHLPHGEAFARAETMITAYVNAGFSKLHLDTSMGCSGESIALTDAETAARAARLCKVAEDAAASSGIDAPVYIIGTEVPVPGGAMEDLDDLQVTLPDAALETLEIHRQAFAKLDLLSAFDRVIGLVVQPGVEFGSENMHLYDRTAAQSLCAIRSQIPQIVFEAHSTDYQPMPALRALVEDGFAILKVGPGLTFALREALYGLDDIASFLFNVPETETLRYAMEALMLKEPQHWAQYYHGTPDMLRLQRHYSYSDRIRYYWPHPDTTAAVNALMQRLQNRSIPETLVSQHFASLYPAVASGQLVATPRNIVIAHIQSVIETYADACRFMT